MQIVNRGYLLLIYKQAYFDWSNQFNEIAFNEGELEPSVYLVEEDFIEEEPIIERNFKKIMEAEFSGVCETEDEWPELSREIFDSFFSVIIGTAVMDTMKNPIQREEL
jgi:hypothetical protein